MECGGHMNENVANPYNYIEVQYASLMEDVSPKKMHYHHP